MICGFETRIESFDNVFKLSQNHSAANQQSIATHLRARGDEHSTAIANEMEKQSTVQ